MDHWCVTMLNADSSGVIDSASPCKWLGHSLLVIETIEEGNYFARQADLINVDGNTVIRIFELSQFLRKKYVKDYTKAETHKRPKEDIQRMMDRIWQKRCDLKEGKPSLSFKIDGDDRPFLKRFFAQNDVIKDRAENIEKDIASITNCTNFCFTSMEVGNIETSSGYKLSNEVFKTPVLYDGFNIKAIMQEGLMITIQTGLYSGVSSILSWLAVGTIPTYWGLWGIPAGIVGGPIATGSVLIGACANTLFRGPSYMPGIPGKDRVIAASIGAIGGGIASLIRVAMKHEKQNSQNALNIEPLSLNSINEKAIKPLILEEDK